MISKDFLPQERSFIFAQYIQINRHYINKNIALPSPKSNQLASQKYWVKFHKLNYLKTIKIDKQQMIQQTNTQNRLFQSNHGDGSLKKLPAFVNLQHANKANINQHKQEQQHENQEQSYPFPIIKYSSNSLQYKNALNEKYMEGQAKGHENNSIGKQRLVLNRFETSIQYKQQNKPISISSPMPIHARSIKSNVIKNEDSYKMRETGISRKHSKMENKGNGHSKYQSLDYELEIQPWQQHNDEITHFQNTQRYGKRSQRKGNQLNHQIHNREKCDKKQLQNRRNPSKIIQQAPKTITHPEGRAYEYYEHRNTRFLPVTTTNEQKIRWNWHMQSMNIKRKKISNMLKMKNYGHFRKEMMQNQSSAEQGKSQYNSQNTYRSKRSNSSSVPSSQVFSNSRKNTIQLLNKHSKNRSMTQQLPINHVHAQQNQNGKTMLKAHYNKQKLANSNIISNVNATNPQIQQLYSALKLYTERSRLMTKIEKISNNIGIRKRNRIKSDQNNVSTNSNSMNGNQSSGQLANGNKFSITRYIKQSVSQQLCRQGRPHIGSSIKGTSNRNKNTNANNFTVSRLVSQPQSKPKGCQLNGFGSESSHSSAGIKLKIKIGKNSQVMNKWKSFLAGKDSQSKLISNSKIGHNANNSQYNEIGKIHSVQCKVVREERVYVDRNTIKNINRANSKEFYAHRGKNKEMSNIESSANKLFIVNKKNNGISEIKSENNMDSYMSVAIQ